MRSATSDIITVRWHRIVAEHEAATRRPLIWITVMQSPVLPQWISVWKATIWFVDFFVWIFFVVSYYFCLFCLPHAFRLHGFFFVVSSLCGKGHCPRNASVGD